MKVTLFYGKRKLVMDVAEHQTVGSMKVFLREKFNLNIQSAQDREDVILHITYAGSYLRDDWILADIGILPGSVLQCSLQSRDKIFLRVYASFNDKHYEFTTPMNFDDTTVETVKSMVQDSSGIPVSMFRLCQKQSENEMFDPRFLSDYNISVGGTVYLDIWDGMGDFLVSVFAGDVTATMQSVVNFHEDPFLHRYQLRVALFIAAYQGNIQLAAHFLKCGSRCEDPVGEHPARDWCKSMLAHPFSLRTPTHAAAQCGRISCLRLFMHHNRSCILAKDGQGSTPTALARRYGQRECFTLLVTEQFRTVKYAGLNLSIYGKVRKWCDRAKDRVAYYRLDSGNPVLLASMDKSAHSATVGSLIQLSGFGETIQSSADKLNKSKIGAKNQWLWPKREQIGDLSKYCDNKKGNMHFPAVRKQNSLPKVPRVVRRTSSLDNRSPRAVARTTQRSTGKGDEEMEKRLSDLEVRFEPEVRKYEAHFDARPIVNKSKDDVDIQYSNFRSPVDREKLPAISQTDREDSFSSGGFFITQDAASTMASKRVRNKLQLRQSQEEILTIKDSLNNKTQKESRKEHGRSSKHLGPRTRSVFSRDANKILESEAHDVIEQATGKTSRQFARASLELGETFTGVGWLRRLQLASDCSRKTLLRGIQNKGRMSREENS